MTNTRSCTDIHHVELLPHGTFYVTFDTKPGEYTYEETEYGKRAYGVVQNGAQSERDPQAQRTAGHDERLPHDQGGHLIPHSQGGRNDESNLVAQDANVNQIDIRQVERTNSGLASNPNNTVYYEVNAYTQPGNERPDAFMVTSAVKNEQTGEVDVQHSSFTNASHQEQEEWSTLCEEYGWVDPRQDIGMSDEDRALANEYADVNVSYNLGEGSSAFSSQGTADGTSQDHSNNYDEGISM